MRPLPFDPSYRIDYGIRWPRYEPDLRKTSVGFVIAGMALALILLVLSAVAEAATFTSGGQTCVLTPAGTLLPDHGYPLTVSACDSIYACRDGGVYTGATLTMQNCSRDRVFASPFDGVMP